MIVETLKSWLCERWPAYRPTRNVEGFYGLVFILEAWESNVFPQKFCVKTIKPDKLKFVCDIKGLFEREMRLWLGIPYHYHVLPALGLELAPPPTDLANKFEVLPLVRMPFCDANLSTIVRGEIIMSTVDRLIILAQACSGLQWLYQHGLQGHGDLKPDNILLSDLRPRFALPDGEGFPSKVHYWQARIADLGWADIWTQGGGTHHAWLPYIAPERFQNIVVPEASDIFAIGVIACELLSEVHPGGDSTEALANKWTKEEWEAWAASAQRVVDVKPTALRDIILRCLEADPKNRPTADDLKMTLCNLLQEIHGLELALQLQGQDEEARKLMLPSHDSWTAIEMSRVSLDQLDKSISRLEGDLHALRNPSSTAYIAKWLETSRGLQKLLLRRRRPDDIERIRELAIETLKFVLNRELDTNLITHILGSSLSDIQPGEIAFGFASEAYANLLRVSEDRDEIIRRYQKPIEALWKRVYPMPLNSLEQVFQISNGMNWPKFGEDSTP